MNEKAIAVLERELKDKLTLLSNHIADQSIDYEYLGDLKDDILDIRRSVAVLKVFSMNDLINDLLRDK